MMRSHESKDRARSSARLEQRKSRSSAHAERSELHVRPTRGVQLHTSSRAPLPTRVLIHRPDRRAATAAPRIGTRPTFARLPFRGCLFAVASSRLPLRGCLFAVAVPRSPSLGCPLRVEASVLGASISFARQSVDAARAASIGAGLREPDASAQPLRPGSAHDELVIRRSTGIVARLISILRAPRRPDVCIGCDADPNIERIEERERRT